MNESYAAAQRHALDTLLALSARWHDALDSLTRLNLATAQAVLEDSAAVSRALLEAGDGADAVARLAALRPAGGERLTLYCRSVYDIALQLHGEPGRALAAKP